MRASPRSLEVRPFAASLGAVLLLLAGSTSTARAQGEPPPAAPPPAVVIGGGNGIGVGAAAFLSGVGGVEVDYDTPMWDADAILGFADRSTGANNNQTQIQFGVQGWYHLHRGSSSDFSLGGGVGLDHLTGGGNPNRTATFIEIGARPRAFITSNVAIHALLGLSISVGDNLGGANNNSGVGLLAQGLFGFGFTYYFK
jgi:hypothetical protein